MLPKPDTTYLQSNTRDQDISNVLASKKPWLHKQDEIFDAFKASRTSAVSYMKSLSLQNNKSINCKFQFYIIDDHHELWTDSVQYQSPYYKLEMFAIFTKWTSLTSGVSCCL